MNEDFVAVCPYCGEITEIYLEADIEGELIQDCEVCCNPWQISVWREGDQRHIEVIRGDGRD